MEPDRFGIIQIWHQMGSESDRFIMIGSESDRFGISYVQNQIGLESDRFGIR